MNARRSRLTRRLRQAVALVFAGLMIAAPLPAPARRAEAAIPGSFSGDYNSSYGPVYALPGWGNVPWGQTKYNSSIQLGDLDGDGKDELVARDAGGVIVHKFDTTSGEWVPVVTEDRTGILSLSDLSDAAGWDQVEYYSTIQLADVDGKSGKELVARARDGIVVYKFGGGAPFNGVIPTGSWQRLGSGGPFADNDCFNAYNNKLCWNFVVPFLASLLPTYFLTIQLADIDGQPGEELIGLGADGLEAYKWNGSGWAQLAGLTGLFQYSRDNIAAWQQYLLTLQFADIDGRPGEELLIRTAAGVLAYAYQSGAWTLLTTPPNLNDCLTQELLPFADVLCAVPLGDSVNSTIQTADLDGQPGEELVGRYVDGIQVFKYTSSSPTSGSWTVLAKTGPFPDSGVWNDPKYFPTIQLADINGDKKVEALGRGTAGIYAYEWDPASNTWSALNNGAASPALADDPWAQAGYSKYYQGLNLRPNFRKGQIQTGNVDGDANAQAELIARGPTGIRTWFYRQNGWERFQSYGSFPNFTGDQAAAYTALNNYLGLDNGTVRDVYTDPTRTPTGDELSGYESSIAARCTGQTTDFPPTFTTCNPPVSGVTTADWTAVSNQIMAELYWARQVINHFAALNALNTSLFTNQNSEFPSITDDLKLPAAGDNAGSANYFNLGASLVENLFKLGGAVFPELGVTASAIGVFLSATAFYSGNSDPDGYQVQHTFAQMQQQVTTIQQQSTSALLAQRPYITGDYGLLTSVGRLVGSQVWTLDTAGALSASRQQFTFWVYQTLLPAVWDKFVITKCVDFSPNSCRPPSGGSNIESSGGDPENGYNFTGLLPKQSPCQTGCGGPFGCTTDCSFTDPDTATVTTLFTPVSAQCTYKPRTTDAWVYGSCGLGVGGEIFNNGNGWNFKTRAGNPDPASGEEK